MPNHKFQVGQVVFYRPASRNVDAPSGGYTVTRRLPQGNDGQFEYRIKHSDEDHERIEGDVRPQGTDKNPGEAGPCGPKKTAPYAGAKFCFDMGYSQ